MSDFKKGDRVEWIGSVSRVRKTGTVDYVTGVGYVHGRRDSDGENFALQASRLTKIAPPTPRFGDVRTGDKITVEVTGKGYGDTVIDTVANVYSPKVIFAGPITLRRKDDGSGWQFDFDHSTTATLTSHTPVEPSWHRAKVIKARRIVPIGEPTDTRGTYLTQSDGAVDRFYDTSGRWWTPDHLTGVVVIVDADGNVVAS